MRFRVRLSPEFDLRHKSLFLAGLSTLGHVDLILDPSIPGHCVSHVECGERKIVVDLWDHADRYDEVGLAWCDLYLKRSLAPGDRRDKVAPFGLNYGGREIYSTARAARVRGDLRKAVDIFRRPHWKDYEQAPALPVDEAVLLQTRLWEEDECPGDSAINEQRIELVAALKQAFGTQFRGGLIDTPLARKMAPQLIAALPSQHRKYVAWQKSCKVGVYTRGLFGSIGFKMAEYLASSKAIVSEPINTVLPEPLTDGKYLAVYNSTDECVERCRQLLRSPEAYRSNAWGYYKEHVRLAAAAVREIRSLIDGSTQ